ncbi:hypothetical protein L484_003178 [Morus notabilis]|uniref:Uncharacterized protein n=1 Tax=Morus notabilis TaxID=981085 RepID=W9RAJ9_9ROSA|nr:hypothetical protein L484_003178 [Morus notabilis]
MADEYAFTVEEMAIDGTVGYPRAYAKLCRDRSAGPCAHGPPFTFMPYCLPDHEVMRARELDQIFPILDPKVKRTAKPKIFFSLLWKQLNHLGRRFNCAKQSEDITVASLQEKAQQARVSHSMVGFSVGHLCKPVLVNLCFCQLRFQAVNSHSFPQHFVESKEKLGLAPAAIVTSRRESYGSSSILQSVDYNRLRSSSLAIAARNAKASKENENPDNLKNPYQALVMARDSLKQREETAKMLAEVQKLDDEVSDTRRKNEEEKLSIQDLELELIKRRRRAEKCRKLAEAQSSYRTMLEKMIRDAMHQSVIYKEQVRLNQAAANALMARLEAQKAICDASEKELHKKYKQKDEIEKQIRPELEQARKRSRMDDTLIEERDQKQKPVLYLPGTRPRTPLHKELRVFLEEEHKASDARLSPTEDEKRFVRAKEVNKTEKDFPIDERRECGKAIVVLEDDNINEQHGYGTSQVDEERKHSFQLPIPREPEIEEDEESRKERGKGNVERWLQMLLENAQGEDLQEEQPQLDKSENEKNMTTDIISKLNLKYPQKEGKNWKSPDSEDRREDMITKQIQKEKSEKSEVNNVTEGVERRSQSVGKERKLVRCESARAFRRIPSSPSIILGMKKGVECIRKKPMVSGDDEGYEEQQHIIGGNSFLKSSIKTIKKAVRI